MTSPVPPAPSDTRRRFLARLSIGLSAVAAAIVAVPVIGFMLRSLLRQMPQKWRDLGPLSQFVVGKTVEVTFEIAHADSWSRESARGGAWLRRDDATHFIAFSMHCTHMGCPVRWRPEATLFMCPCHGGVYHSDGSVAAGPPQHPLPRYPVRIRGDRLEISTDATSDG
jgi:menaquinol-cytochrome c reductase iron-sulfur subunit